MVEGTGVNRRDPYLDPADPTARLDSNVEGENPEEIRQDIEDTRAAMTETIDAIEAKLSPDNLKAEAKEAVRDATLGKAEAVVNNVQESAKDMVDSVQETGGSLWDTVKSNPVPAAMAAIGIGWLVMKSRDHQTQRSFNSTNWSRQPGNWNAPGQRYAYGNYQGGTYGTGYVPGAGQPYGQGNYTYGTGYGYAGGGQYQGQEQGDTSMMDQAGQTAGQVKDQAGQMVGQVTDQAGQVVDQAQQMAGQWADQAQQQFSQFAGTAQDQAQQWQSQFQRTMRDNPLAVGAVALGLGLAVGLAVPETEQEDQYLGPTRDKVVDKAGNVVTQAADKAQDMVHDAAGSMSPNQGQSQSQNQKQQTQSRSSTSQNQSGSGKKSTSSSMPHTGTAAAGKSGQEESSTSASSS